MSYPFTPPKKISHKVFEATQMVHIWIEQHDGHYAVQMTNNLVGQMQPTTIGVHKNLLHAEANMSAIIVLFTPNIIEGSLRDVSEFDKEES